jgi:hypothetical protein
MTDFESGIVIGAIVANIIWVIALAIFMRNNTIKARV